MAEVDINTLTMEQYLSLSRENQALGMVKPEIGGNVNFKIKSQLMRELREDTFSKNKNEDGHDHIDRHDRTSSRNISSSSDTGGLAAVISKLDNLRHDMKKLKQNVHAIQVGCQICEGPYLDKECPLNEEVKLVEEVKYGASVNVIPRNIFKYLRLANLRNANMLVQMTDMTKKAPLGNDRTIFDMEKKDHNFMIPAAKILLINNNEPSFPPGTPPLKSLKTYNSQDMQEQQVKKNLRLNENILVKHFCKPIVQTYNGKARMCPTSDPDKSIYDRGVKIYGRSRVGNLRICYANWYRENSHDNKPRPRDYTFREWMMVKVGHTNVNESIKKALLKSWVIDRFKEALDPDKDPMKRSSDDYK
nr:hypothetical protein [Tanacetum cinerariifolium]